MNVDADMRRRYISSGRVRAIGLWLRYVVDVLGIDQWIRRPNGSRHSRFGRDQRMVKLNKAGRVKVELRENEALRLKVQGFMMEAIGVVLGVSGRQISTDIRNALIRDADDRIRPEEKDEHRALQTMRIERAMMRLDGELTKGNMQAFGPYIRLLELYNRLYGLDVAPKGLPGSSPDSPMWLSIAELADRMKEADPEWQEIRPGMEIQVNESADD